MKSHKIFSKELLLSLILICRTQIWSAELPDPPPPRSRQEIEGVLAKAQKLRSPSELKPLNLVLVADTKDHGPHEHDYPLWQKRWQILLSESGLDSVNLYGPPRDNPRSKSSIGLVKVTSAQGWPSKQQLFLADVVVVFCYIKWNEQKLSQLQEYLNDGGGLVLIHSATWTRPQPSEEVAKLTGCGGFAKYRHGSVKLKIVDPNHPICFGLPEQIEFIDESYWPPTPMLKGSSMHILAISNENARKDSSGAKPQPMFWTYEYCKGRVFGCVLGHYTWTFDDPYFRLLLLRGMAWSARQSSFRLDKLATRGIVLKD